MYMPVGLPIEACLRLALSLVRAERDALLLGASGGSTEADGLREQNTRLTEELAQTIKAGDDARKRSREAQDEWAAENTRLRAGIDAIIAERTFPGDPSRGAHACCHGCRRVHGMPGIVRLESLEHWPSCPVASLIRLRAASDRSANHQLASTPPAAQRPTKEK